ncbi:hypothetical protein D9M73_203140 [compost metagenome]
MIDEIQGSVRGDGRSGGGIEAARQFLDLGVGEGPRRRRGNGSRGQVKRGKFPLADFEAARDILNGVFVGEFAGPQIGRAAILVACAKATFGIDVDIAEMKVPRVG